MNNEHQVLEYDLKVLEAMAAEMEDYLRSEATQWAMTGLDTPRLTGEFVWLSLWQPAYPSKKYWWLYGTPKHT